jgi:formate hydrogenlyase subunit 3/multisubunit Na+/H+ antiporter MnhD subunit
VTGVLIGIGLLLLGAAGSATFRRHPWGDRIMLACLGAGTVVAGVPAVQVIVGGDFPEIRWHPALPGGAWVVGLDPLSAIFLLTILGVGLASAVFGVTSLGAARQQRAVWFSHASFALVLAGMSLVVVARSVLLFLGAWEVMALGSYVLIVTEHEHATVRRAGLLYLVATHVGTLALFAMFALLIHGSGDWTFASIAAARIGAPLTRTAAVFALALCGFGIKAGLVPFHFWLPPAHAAAPSHISALMSGIVIKMGIYGILRVIVLAGAPPRWWGWTVLALGVASAVLGVLWALVQHDFKRLLAYHSVENIGIILIGTGVGAIAAASGHPTLAILGYAAAVLHTVNHALFKSALFLAAGAVYHATGTRNLERLGGLARRMPVTWLGFLIGATAIVGLPPLNGFVSEWLVFQGLLRAGRTPEALRLAIFAAPALALIGGLALACFAKVAGLVFLGTPRSDEARAASEVGGGMRWPVLALACCCVVIGLIPVLFLRPVMLAGAGIAGAGPGWDAVATADVMAGAQRISIVAVVLMLVCLALWSIRRLALPARAVRTGATWGCGYPDPTPRMQYTASSFAAPLAAMFGSVAGVREHRGATVFHSTPADPVLDSAVLPLWNQVQRLAMRLRPMQQGRLHIYLIYVVATVVALLVYLVVAPVT